MGPLLGNELPMPTKDGVGSHERSNFDQGTSSNDLAADSEPASLIIAYGPKTETIAV